MTTTRRTCGKASKRWAKERIAAHEVQAKKTARAKSTAKVNCQSSLCRFSNCSKREEIEVRLPAPGDEPPAGREPRWFSSTISAGVIRENPGPFVGGGASTILETPTGFSNGRGGGKFLNYTCRNLEKKDGVPLITRRRLILSAGAVGPAGGLTLCGGVRLGVLLEEVERSRFFGGDLGGFRNLLDGSRGGHFRQQLNAAVVLEARTSGDEPAHDDVFLEAAKIVHLAGDGRFGEDAGGLLETRCGDERISRERGLGDAKEERTARCGAAAIGDNAIVFLAEAELVHLLLKEERGITHVLDLDPAHHLARDRLDVLVVDVDALEAVNLLNGINQVRLRELFAEDGEQVMQVERAIDEGLTGLDVVPFLNVDVHAAGDGVFLGGLAILAFDVNFAHALGDIAIADDAVDFTDDGGILGFAGLEKFDNARETARDVLGLSGFARDLRQHVASLDLVAILDHQVGAGRHEVLLADLAGRIADQDRGLMLLIARRQSDDVLREAGHFVHLLFDRQAGAQVVKLHGAGGFGEDREGEGIPFGKNLAVGDVFAVLDAEARAVNNVVALLLAVLFIDDGDQSGAVHGDGSAATAFDKLHVHELDDAVVARFERGAFRDARGGSADVEGAHGQLRAGLADGLRGDDADGFAKLNHAASGEVAPVA